MTTLTTIWPDAALTAEVAYRRERLDDAARPSRRTARRLVALRRTRTATTALPAHDAVLGDFAVCR